MVALILALKCKVSSKLINIRVISLATINVYKRFIIIIIDREALAKKGDNALGSVRPSVRQSVRSFVCLFACRYRGSALPSAARSNKSHYQSKVFVCVSIIMGRILIIARMRSIGF